MSSETLQKFNPVERQTDDPEYSPEDTEGIDRAAAGATQVVEEALRGERHRDISYTDDGVRSVVETSIADAYVRVEFANELLKKIEFTLDNDNGDELSVGIIDPESPHPKVTVGDKPVDPREIPAVNAMLEQLRMSLAEKSKQSVDDAAESHEATETDSNEQGRDANNESSPDEGSPDNSEPTALFNSQSDEKKRALEEQERKLAA